MRFVCSAPFVLRLWNASSAQGQKVVATLFALPGWLVRQRCGTYQFSRDLHSLSPKRLLLSCPSCALLVKMYRERQEVFLPTVRLLQQLVTAHKPTKVGVVGCPCLSTHCPSCNVVCFPTVKQQKRESACAKQVSLLAFVVSGKRPA